MRASRLLLLLCLLGCERVQDQQTASAIQATAVPQDSLLAVGEALYFAADYDSATAMFQRGLADTRARADTANQARFLMWLGITAWKTGDFENARTLGEQSLVLKAEHGMTGELSRSHNSLGLVAIAEYRLADALSHFEQAVQTARAASDDEGVGRAGGNLGLVATYLGDPDGGRAYLRSQLDAGRRLGNERFQANALANLAMINIWAGEPQPAVEQLDSARILYRSLEQPDGEPNALGQLAEAYAAMGDFRRAFAAIDTALAVARRLGLRAEEEENLRLSAGLHAQLGDHRRALALYNDAERLTNEIGFEAQRALILRRRSEVHAALGNAAAALRDAEAALRINQAARARFDELEDHLLIAQLHHAAGRVALADEALARARSLAPKLAARSARVAVALAEARMADRAGDAARVLRALGTVTPDLVPGDYQSAWEADALAARAYTRLGQADSAVAAGRRAVASIRATRSDLQAQTLRSSFTAERSDVFADLVLALLKLNRAAEAFEVADAARGDELIGHLGSARRALAAESAGGVAEADELLRRIDALLRELNRIERTPPRERGAGVTATLTEVQARLAVLRTEYETRSIRAAHARSSGARLLGAAGESTRDVQQALRAGEAVVEYMLVPGRVIVFVVTRAAVQVIDVPADHAAIAGRIRILRDIWSTPDRRWKDALPAAQALHATLMAPVLGARATADARRLIIVPHGLLAQVPFAALVNTDARFLAQDYDIVYLPSAASLSALRAREATGPSSGAIALAPFPQSLPASVVEARAVRDRVRRASLLAGTAATELALRQALGQRRIVHVASHGILNASNPMFSRIELAPGSRSGDDDGRLEIHELLGLAVRSALVFLSGCETGASSEWLDQLVRGSGELALSQAFLYAGASAVVATLWRIDDDGAARFADEFYRQLRGSAPDRALSAAQRTLMGDARYANPYYWAAYTLSGLGQGGS